MTSASTTSRVARLVVGFGLAAAVTTGNGVAHADDTDNSQPPPGATADTDTGSTVRPATEGTGAVAAEQDADDPTQQASPEPSAEPTATELPVPEGTSDETSAEETSAEETSISEVPTEESTPPPSPEAESPSHDSAAHDAAPEADANAIAGSAPVTETSSAATTFNVAAPTSTDIATPYAAQTVNLDVPMAALTATREAAVVVAPAVEPAPANVITSVISGFLSFLGLSPLASSAPTEPLDSPMLWTLAAWVRRELFNTPPTAAYNPATNSLLDDGSVTGQVVITDVNGDPVTVVASAAARGTVAINDDGTFTYIPDAEFAVNGGTDTFTVTVKEAGNPGLLNSLTWGLLGGANSVTTAVTVTAGPIKVAIPTDGYGFGEGANLVYLSDEELARELDAVVAAGGTRLRVPVMWSLIEPAPGQYDWSSTDRIIAAAKERDLDVLAVFLDAPDWARQGIFSAPPDDMGQLALFSQMTVSRYGSYVDDWQVWNEPNLAAYYGFTSDRPQNYTAMLKAVYPAIKAIQPNSTVVAAGLAREEGVDSPGVFLLQMYEAGAQGYFDAFAMHPYVFPGGIESDPLNAWSDVERVHYAMTVFGDGDKKIWLTEVGAPTTCEACAVLEPFLGPSAITVSEQEQAKQITDVFAAANELGYVGPIFVHGIRDQGIVPEFYSDSHFGSLLTNDGQPKYTGWILANANRPTPTS